MYWLLVEKLIVDGPFELCACFAHTLENIVDRICGARDFDGKKR